MLKRRGEHHPEGVKFGKYANGAGKTDPKLILLDEPTTALDLFTQAEILDFLRESKEHVNL